MTRAPMHLDTLRRHPARAPRRGAITVYVLLGMTALVAAVALAVDAANLANARVELRASTDAATLAAAQCLVDDRLLSGLLAGKMGAEELPPAQRAARATSGDGRHA